LSSTTNPTVRSDAIGTVRVVDAASWAPSDWDELAVRTTMGEAFQSHAWGELKRSLGWTPLRYSLHLDGVPIAVVSIQERSLLGRRGGPLGRYAIHYAPRGPVLLRTTPEAVAAALAGLLQIASAHHSVALTIDPAWEEGSEAAMALGRAGFRSARREIQVSRTAMVVPLEPTEEAQHALLADSTARNINKARRAGVTTEQIDWTDTASAEAALEEFFDMHAATGRREGFLVRDRTYELEQWRRLGESGLAGLWLASYGGRLRNGALVLHCGKLLVSYAAGSSDDADLRKTRANHLLQWDIIRWAAGAGFSGYDLGGVDTHSAPGFPEDESHPLWNLYQFKRSFGARPVLRIRAHEYARNVLLGTAWQLARRLR
jgi:lipid II:glycine glycyltransferase (peptidoglycan interpeptide bridge formation enzyme)